MTDLDELPHLGPTGRVLLAAAVAGNGASDDAVARAASMPVAIVRDVLLSMLDRCLHVPVLLVAKVNRHPARTIDTGHSLVRHSSERDEGRGAGKPLAFHLLGHSFEPRTCFRALVC